MALKLRNLSSYLVRQLFPVPITRVSPWMYDGRFAEGMLGHAEGGGGGRIVQLQLVGLGL